MEHHHDHVHLDDADWEAMVDHAELEGELFVGFVRRAVAWVGAVRDADADGGDPTAPAVRRVLDIGSGPGVGTCELARLFPEAAVVAVDASPAMLARTAERAAAHGLAARVSTHRAELPDGIEGAEAVAALGHADVVWASLSLHHVGDEVRALRALHALLDPQGVVAIAEVGAPLRILAGDGDGDRDLGRPGLTDRLDAADAGWFSAMRAGLAGSVPSADLPSMLVAAGFDVVRSQPVRERLAPPPTDATRRMALNHVRRQRTSLADRLDPADLRALDVLADPDDPRGVQNRGDVQLTAVREIAIARPRPPAADRR